MKKLLMLLPLLLFGCATPVEAASSEKFCIDTKTFVAKAYVKLQELQKEMRETDSFTEKAVLYGQWRGLAELSEGAAISYNKNCLVKKIPSQSSSMSH